MYNTGSTLTGILVERASGQPFETFLKERIFDPLGMVDTGFTLPPEKLARFTVSQERSFSTGELSIYDGIEDSQWLNPPALPDGAGGLVSTVDDYLAFAAMLLGNGRYGHERLLSRPSIELMTTNQLTPEQYNCPEILEDGWGFGVGVVTKKRQVAYSVGSYGWTGGLGAIWYNDPREELISMMFTTRNFDSPALQPHFLDFQTSVYQALDD
jgi:CubicO group peptidase (beta-lactamase class C family)